MKKVFILAGELSGDRLAAWYVQRELLNQSCIIHGIGGDLLVAQGIVLYERLERLNVSGLIEIIPALRRLLGLLRSVSRYIIEHDFDEVIVVDFPGFNMRLIKRLKRLKPTITITYLSPPQLWCWGAWRLKALQRDCDRVLVIYPHEVAWYQARGLDATWVGCPVAEQLRDVAPAKGQPSTTIGLMPGSRVHEMRTLLPIFLQAAKLIKQRHPEVTFVMVLAPSIAPELIAAVVRRHGLESIYQSVRLVQSNEILHCCVALSKPGTITLELALLGIPTIVGFKTSWLTYVVGRLLVQVNSMSLPNLLLGTMLVREHIQSACTPEVLAQSVSDLYLSTHRADQQYVAFMHNVNRLKNMLIAR